MSAPVRLNVYDMHWSNEYAHSVGFGVFHSGIEVYGVEYAYGGHQFPFSGIFTNTPQDAEELGDTFKFRESIYLGETALSKKSVDKLVKSIGDEFRGDRYHLITKNCNHFSAYLAKELTGVEAPQWVNRLATFSGSLPFLQRWLPPEWLTPIVMDNSLENSGEICANSTLNYPTSAIDRAEEALTLCGVPPVVQPTSSNGQASSSNGISKLFRRTSEAQTAPNSARDTSSNTTPPLMRLWNSIRNIATEDQPPARTTNPK